jgi:hypothetical protein
MSQEERPPEKPGERRIVGVADFTAAAFLRHLQSLSLTTQKVNSRKE